MAAPRPTTLTQSRKAKRWASAASASLKRAKGRRRSTRRRGPVSQSCLSFSCPRELCAAWPSTVRTSSPTRMPCNSAQAPWPTTRGESKRPAFLHRDHSTPSVDGEPQALQAALELHCQAPGLASSHRGHSDRTYTLVPRPPPWPRTTAPIGSSRHGKRVCVVNFSSNFRAAASMARRGCNHAVRSCWWGPPQSVAANNTVQGQNQSGWVNPLRAHYPNELSSKTTLAKTRWIVI